ncbi:MAG: type II toxin-antitoxin system RelE/ParE family toxin [Thermodesulfobacteriota bacterium]|nr:type II toxin-antitoxin system RelE/ParE family toxin [Thermodesulfobacteriota bacterium]
MFGWRVRIAKQADRDIADILRWTAAHFSPQQADVYAETLTLSMNTLLQGHEVPGARIRNDILPGLFSLHVARQGRRGSHFIMFRPDDTCHCIDVLRVLHDSLDLRRHV